MICGLQSRTLTDGDCVTLEEAKGDLKREGEFRTDTLGWGTGQSW